MVRLAFLHDKGKEHPTGSARPNLKIRNAMLIDFSGKKKFLRVIAREPLVTELHHG
jgi:hypothetical protein